MYYLLLMVIIICGGCLNESTEHKKEKLHIILKDDLDTIIEDITKENLADSVYYTIVSYKEFSQGKYSAQAIVDFFFFKDIDVKVVRKYRYHRDYKKWDRYFNEYKFYSLN